MNVETWMRMEFKSGLCIPKDAMQLDVMGLYIFPRNVVGAMPVQDSMS